MPAKKKLPPESEPPKKSRRFEMLFDPAWYARIKAQADRLGMRPAAYIRLSVTERVLRDEGGHRSASEL